MREIILHTKPRILNISLMLDSCIHGYQSSMRNIASEYLAIGPSKDHNWNQNIITIAEQFKPDLIFLQIQDEGVLHLHTAQRLAQMAFVMNWTGDIRQDVPNWMIDIGRQIQLTCFSNMEDVKKCRAMDIKSDYLEIGVNTHIYKNINSQKCGPQIVAHFNDYHQPEFPLSQYRREVVNRLQSEFGNNFGVFGNYPNAKGNFNSSQEMENDNYNKALIAINCSHFNAELYSSDRILRIMSSGTFCLSHNFKRIEEIYKIGEHLDVFNDLDEMASKCRHYLANNESRAKIAKAGSEYVRENFSFSKMAQNILKLYNLYRK